MLPGTATAEVAKALVDSGVCTEEHADAAAERIGTQALAFLDVIAALRAVRGQDAEQAAYYGLIAIAAVLMAALEGDVRVAAERIHGIATAHAAAVKEMLTARGEQAS